MKYVYKIEQKQFTSLKLELKSLELKKNQLKNRFRTFFYSIKPKKLTQ